MEIISISIDLNKIDKSKIQTTDRNGKPYASGGKYYPLNIIISDQADQYGNNVSVCTAQTKEERERREKRAYLGNGKVVWQSDGATKQPTREEPSTKAEIDGYKMPHRSDDGIDNEIDNLPF